MITRRSALAASAAAWIAGPVRAAGVNPPTLEELTRPAMNRDAALSRDGRRIALLHELREKSRRLAFVSLIDADALEKPPLRVIIGNYDVEDIQWANDERLLISIVIPRTDGYVETGTRFGTSYNTSLRRLLSVGLDGSPVVTMFGQDKAMLGYNFNASMVVDLLPDDPRRILMQAYEPSGTSIVLFHVDVYTGEATLLERGGPSTATWSIQDGKPILRWESNRRGTTLTLLGRAPGETEWKFVRKISRRNQLERADFDVVGMTENAGVFLAVHRADDEPAASLRPFDIRTMSFGAPIAVRPGRDIDGAVTDRRGRYVGAIYTEDRVAYDFADPSLGAHFRGVEAFFEKGCNVRVRDMDEARNRFLLRISGPRLPRAFYFYDRQARRLEAVAIGKPWLAEASLAPMEAFDVAARDGTKLRAYLTKPLAGGPRPLVVMPHGGPEVRDAHDFDLVGQAMAAQGWLVLQVNFRGSGGYGRAFADAGRRRWADLMQEDVEDAVAHVLASGQADPQRVAIWGASYGGYAALMGAVRRPELYRCAVSVAGVSDLPEFMADSRREDGEDAAAYRYWLKTIGDPAADKAMLESASPRHRAGGIKAPILLIHGMNDGIVPYEQSKLMSSALRASGKSVELISLRETGHSGWDHKTWRQVLDPSVAFIAKAFA
jgi:acetyl esterase/lipase